MAQNNILMGFVFALGTLGISLLSIFLGRLSRTYGKNKLIVAGSLLGIVYPLVYATSANIFQYMGGKLIFAFAGAAMGPLLMAYLQDSLSASREQGKLIGYLYSMQSIAGGLGAIIGGFLADKYFLAAPYYLQSVVLFLPFVLALVFLKGKEKINGIKTRKSDYFFGLRYILSRPYLLYHFILEFPFKMNWAAKVILYPLIVVSFIDSNTITGSIFASQGFVAMIVLLFAGTFVDKKSYLVGMNTAFLVLAVASLLMAFSNNLFLFWIFAALFAVGEAISGPAKGVLEIKNIEDDCRAEVIAVITTFGYLVESMSPLFAGLLLSFLPARTVLLAYSFLIWISLFIANSALRRQNQGGNQ